MSPLDAGRAGLCASCVNAHLITSSKGSTFLRCDLSFRDPRFARYPALPVRRCAGYAPDVPPALPSPDRGSAL